MGASWGEAALCWHWLSLLGSRSYSSVREGDIQTLGFFGIPEEGKAHFFGIPEEGKTHLSGVRAQPGQLPGEGIL